MSGDAEQIVGRSKGRTSGDGCGLEMLWAQWHKAVPCLLKELNPVEQTSSWRYPTSTASTIAPGEEFPKPRELRPLIPCGSSSPKWQSWASPPGPSGFRALAQHGPLKDMDRFLPQGNTRGLATRKQGVLAKAVSCSINLSWNEHLCVLDQWLVIQRWFIL